jgi:predicted nucleotidyltransferase
MSTHTISDLISTTLFGKTRRAILSLLYTHPDEKFYLRQIARFSNTGMGSVQRELKLLLNAGIIKAEPRGNMVNYHVNDKCTVYSELKGIIIKTAGMGDAIKASLSSISDKIKTAFIYGSFARGQERKDSDIDLMIIGDVSFSDAVESISSAQTSIGREINPSVYPVEEFRKKLKEGNHFLTSLLGDKKIFLIGDEDELGKLAG